MCARRFHLLLLIQTFLNRVRREIPDALLLIAGEGPALEDLKHQVDKLALDGNVMFIGYLDRNSELNSCYRSADIFVFSSKTETQGLVLLEAMAQGVPVVSIAEMGTRDVLHEGSGVWIAQDDVEDFSARVIAMLGDDAARTMLGETARDYAQAWSAEKLAQRMHSFYEAVVSAQRHGRPLLREQSIESA